MTKIVLPLPPTTNATYRYGKGFYYKIQSARDWELEAFPLLYNPKKRTIHGSCEVTVDWFLSRDRDIDGGLKIILDMFEKAKVIKNDSQIVNLKVRKFIDKTTPRVEVDLWRCV